VYSAGAELCGGRKLRGSLQPHRYACKLDCSRQDKKYKKECRSFLDREHSSYDYILLLPHLGCCNRARSSIMGIICCHLGCDRKAKGKATEEDPQQVEQGSLAFGMNRDVHPIQKYLDLTARQANACLKFLRHIHGLDAAMDQPDADKLIQGCF